MATASGSDDCVTFRRALRRAAPGLQRPLPWIDHADPWAILVSEVMLQQTQTSRVVSPWTRFLQTFPTANDCADAPLSRVLQLWEGLGYHRRAKALHAAAKRIRDDFAGELPRDASTLRLLPGVGEYTANAVASFAFGQRVAVIDTNVGRVLARALANRSLTQSEARVMARQLLPASNVAMFNQALLDLGSQFCRSVPVCATCPVQQHCAWFREGGDDPAPNSAGVSRAQSKFEGSNRQVRGQILGLLRERPLSNRRLLTSMTHVEEGRLAQIIEGLITDGLVERTTRGLKLAS